MTTNKELEGSQDRLSSLMMMLKELEKTHKKSMTKVLGGWWPSYVNAIDYIVPILYSLFGDMYRKVGKERPVFVDLGSGYSEIAVIASLAGFKSFGIEINHQHHQGALQFRQELVTARIINEDDLTPVWASYYPTHNIQKGIAIFNLLGSADVLYSYPSDKSFEKEFVPLMRGTMKHGSYLLMVGGSGQTNKAVESGWFDNHTFAHVFTENLIHCFQKK